MKNRILRISHENGYTDFQLNKVLYYHFEEQLDGKMAFVVSLIDEDGRHIFDNNKNLKIQLIEGD